MVYIEHGVWNLSVGLLHILNCTFCDNPITLTVATPRALNEAHLQVAGKAAALKPASFAARVSVCVWGADRLRPAWVCLCFSDGMCMQSLAILRKVYPIPQSLPLLP